MAEAIFFLSLIMCYLRKLEARVAATDFNLPISICIFQDLERRVRRGWPGRPAATGSDWLIVDDDVVISGDNVRLPSRSRHSETTA